MYLGGFMKYIFIVNPMSGNGKGAVVSQVIKEYCNKLNVNFKIICTKSKGDAKNIASLYKNKNIVVYSVGGDGTLNEVVNGLYNSKSTLGIVPVGTGNDFYKSLVDYSSNIIDIGKVNDRYFINIASVGLDAEVADLANYLKDKKLSKNLVYILSLIKNYFSYKNKKIKIDGREENITILTICNGKYYGNGFKIAPNAKLNSGLFDVCEVKDIKKLEMIPLISKLVKGTHITDNKVNIYSANKINIESPVNLACNIDGEIIKDNKFEFSIIPNALSIDYKDNLKINKFLKEKKLIK